MSFKIANLQYVSSYGIILQPCQFLPSLTIVTGFPKFRCHIIPRSFLLLRRFLRRRTSSWYIFISRGFSRFVCLPIRMSQISFWLNNISNKLFQYFGFLISDVSYPDIPGKPPFSFLSQMTTSSEDVASVTTLY